MKAAPTWPGRPIERLASVALTPHLPLLLLVLSLAALRLVTLLLALGEGGPGLHVDEAQYWQWSRALDWGYYSKPPVIAVLLAGATALFGDGVLAVKSVALLLYPLTGLVLGVLATRLARDHGLAGPAAHRAGLIAAALFMASPLAALLGLAATTDAPLLLCWSLASLLLWQARQALAQGRRARLTWLALGLVCGIGLLSKYSYAAWIAGALAWIWLDRPDAPTQAAGCAAGCAAVRAERRRGLLSAAGVTLALLLPHLAWNAAMGWPTLQHTAEITAVQHGAEGGLLATLARSILRSLSVPLGAALMVGPVLFIAMLLSPFLLLIWRRGGPTVQALRPLLAAAPLRYVAVLHLPLLLAGMLQALRGEPQINWVAPLVPGLVLLLGVAFARLLGRPALLSKPSETTRAGLRPGRWRGGPWPAVLLATIGLHLAIGAALPLAHELSQWWRRAVDPQAATLPRQFDIWARMRGWPEAWDALRPALVQARARTPDLPLLTASRSVITTGDHAWRDLALPWRAWTEGGPPHSHHQMVAGWTGLPPHDGPVLIVADAALPEALLARLQAPELLAVAHGRAGAHSTVTLRLWRAETRSPAP